MPRKEGGDRETSGQEAKWRKEPASGGRGGRVASEAGLRVRSIRKVNNAAQIRIPGRKGGESVRERASP